MKKSEGLVATLLVIYGVLCGIGIALYALIQLFVEDKPTATNLLIWSATIFAPIAVLMTYTNWKEQKGSELVSTQALHLIVYLKDYKVQTNKILGIVLNNYLHDSDNEIVKKYLNPKIELVEIIKMWGELKLPRKKINDSLAFINFNQDNEKLASLIEEYEELTSKIDRHIYGISNQEIYHQFFIMHFSDNIEALISEMYEYALFRKTLHFNQKS